MFIDGNRCWNKPCRCQLGEERSQAKDSDLPAAAAANPSPDCGALVGMVGGGGRGGGTLRLSPLAPPSVCWRENCFSTTLVGGEKNCLCTIINRQGFCSSFFKPFFSLRQEMQKHALSDNKTKNTGTHAHITTNNKTTKTNRRNTTSYTTKCKTTAKTWQKTGFLLPFA